MSQDVMDQIARIIEWVTSLGIALPFVIFFVVQLFTRGKSKSGAERPANAPAERQAPPTNEAPAPFPGFPAGLPSWMGLDGPAPVDSPQPARATTFEPPARETWSSQWGHTFDSNDADDHALVWRSQFDDENGQRQPWKSIFDEEAQVNVYGWEGTRWEGTRWGGTFPPRDSEPVIHHN